MKEFERTPEQQKMVERILDNPNFWYKRFPSFNEYDSWLSEKYPWPQQIEEKFIWKSDIAISERAFLDFDCGSYGLYENEKCIIKNQYVCALRIDENINLVAKEYISGSKKMIMWGAVNDHNEEILPFRFLPVYCQDILVNDCIILGKYQNIDRINSDYDIGYGILNLRTCEWVLEPKESYDDSLSINWDRNDGFIIWDASGNYEVANVSAISNEITYNYQLDTLKFKAVPVDIDGRSKYMIEVLINDKSIQQLMDEHNEIFMIGENEKHPIVIDRIDPKDLYEWLWIDSDKVNYSEWSLCGFINDLIELEMVVTLGSKLVIWSRCGFWYEKWSNIPGYEQFIFDKTQYFGEIEKLKKYF